MNDRTYTPAQRTLITTALILATILSSVASTIANVVLPEIRASTGAAQDQVSWVLTSFILAGVLVTPAIGWLEGQVGRRTILLVAIVGYGIASSLCGLASDIYVLVLCRVVQGAFGAVFIPMSQAILLDINPPEKHGQAMSVWGMGAVLGPIIGPVLGGWLTDNLSWRWVFFMNLPVAVVAFFLISAALPRRGVRDHKPFDAFGFVALAAGLAGLQIMLDRGPGREWFASPEIWIECALAVFGFYIFVVHTATARRPLFERSILTDSNFVIAATMIVFFGALLFAGAAVLPTLLQSLLNYPVLHTGLVQIPRGLGSFAAMFLVGRLVGRIDSRILVLVGVGLTGLSYLEMSHFSLGMDEHLALIAGFLQGLGVGIVFVPLSALAFNTISPALRTQAAAIFTLIRNTGSSVGISLVGALQIYNSKIVQSRLLEEVTPDNQNVVAAGVDMNSLQGLAQLARAVSRQAAMVAYIDSFHFLYWLCILIAPLVLLIRSKRKPVIDA
ncbi:MAG TPA: DHA2 family efflux MFS transporter permease subunit [Caulobacterales bacterium]|nr:DHA2 family efflux MFS transporter permease subunit [Caulobacterales bacterium]